MMQPWLDICLLQPVGIASPLISITDGVSAASEAGGLPCSEAADRKSGPSGSTTATPIGSSTLSPAAAPFYLGCPREGRSKHRRWADEDDGSEDSNGHPQPPTWMMFIPRLGR